MWTQLYTIHRQRTGIRYIVTCVFALLPNKRKEMYLWFFGHIKSWKLMFMARIGNLIRYCQHPKIWKLLDSLKIQQALSTNTIHPGAAEATRNNRIQNLIDNYTRSDADRLRRRIAYNYMG